MEREIHIIKEMREREDMRDRGTAAREERFLAVSKCIKQIIIIIIITHYLFYLSLLLL